MDKIIKFSTKEEHMVHPQPASRYVPEWYRKAERFVGGKKILSSETALGMSTVKTCMPFLDALTSGYVVELWQDLQVTIEHGKPNLRWGGLPKVATERSLQALQHMPIPSEYHEVHFGWHFPFYVQVPKGYSILVAHPLNKFDLPFTTMSGVVDADTIMGAGTMPFLLKKDFEGIIPMGTPIAQIIPFKRDNWINKIDDSIVQKSEKNSSLMRRVASGYYKHNMWKRKSYK
jgi:hypothetical protein